MKIAIIGTGYVGLPTGVGLAELGHDVVCIDREQSKIDTLKSGKITLFEEGLEELFQKNLNSGNISFTTSMQEGVNGAQIVFIAVGTPPHPVTKEADMKYVYSAATELADYLTEYTIIANKSTVPVGTGDSVESIIEKKNPNAQFDVISLPEFLREGFAVYDFFNPDRIVIGINSNKPKAYINELYEKLSDKTELLYVERRSAELIKYASNAFLALKIHYINEMANFCEKSGARIDEVAKGMGLDSRIGKKFLNTGPGYGGSCFPKDTLAMAYMARQNDIKMTLIDATIEGNTNRKIEMAQRILNAVKNIDNPKIGVLGLAFKNGTDDCRESPAIEIIYELLTNKQVSISAYDPKALETAQELLQNKIEYKQDMLSVAKDADVLAILTEWDEFKTINLKELKKIMKTPNIIDCRNLLDIEQVRAEGFSYQPVGREKI